MELQLKNIGMIKEANVKIDGLTVIAGENDTGKSTVGKALFAILKSIEKGFTKRVRGDLTHRDSFQVNFFYLWNKLFKEYSLSEGGYVGLNIGDGWWSVKRDDKFSSPNIGHESHGGVSKDTYDIIFIESPLVWNFAKFFNDVSLITQEMNLSLDFPYLMRDLFVKLSIKSTKEQSVDIETDIFSIIKGLFIQDDKGIFFYHKDEKDIEMINTATGIKTFGIFQVLSQNNWLNENTVLILDEPEVHLHPKWQLEMAKVIVELVKNGVKVVVNSHSPYMIEALQRYSEKEEVTADFYLAEDGYIHKIEDSNSQTLAKIFEKLSEPFDVFEAMESESMERLING